jgi:phage-related tail fiber protein
VLADGTNGTLDLRGEFIRGWDNGRGVDAGRSLGSWQADEFKSHTHTYNKAKPLYANLAGGGNVAYPTGGTGITNATGGSETRPRNVALLACMKQ